MSLLNVCAVRGVAEHQLVSAPFRQQAT